MKVLRNTEDNSVNPWNAVLVKEPNMQELEVDPAVVAMTGFLDEAGSPVAKDGTPMQAPSAKKPAKRRPRAKKAAVTDERLDAIAKDVAETAVALDVELGSKGDKEDPLAVLRGNADGLGQ